MAVAFYMDVHVPQAVANQLLRRGVDVLTALEDQASTLDDSTLLERALVLNRVTVTFDVRFKAMAEDWQRSGRTFQGLIYAHPLRVSIGQLVRDLEVIAGASEADEWRNAIERLPL